MSRDKGMSKWWVCPGDGYPLPWTWDLGGAGYPPGHGTRDTTRYGRQEDATHPTAMHSCLVVNSLLKKKPMSAIT